ncbi:MAG: baseplate J/gp47 family protein [Ignavibacteriaceae bacterium]|jgi:hypothetical protein|nr:baseplate J/gp47 family protein [Ignavibacteriaceae bacterium]
MKTPNEILKDLSGDFITEQSKVTYLGQESVVRGILSAVKNVLFELWNDLLQQKRKIFLDTSKSSDLDTFGTKRGLTRGIATKSSNILLFNGPTGTVIVSGTAVKSVVSGEQCTTLSQIILGENNILAGDVISNSIGNAVLAESVNTGKKTRVGVKELIQFVTPISGVTVTNLVPSVGGEDAESDEVFRERIRNYIKTLNQGTRDFYSALAKTAESSINKVKVKSDPANMGVKLYLLKNSFAQYTSTELLAIAASVYDSQRACNNVRCLNVSIKSISVVFDYEGDGTTSQDTVFSSAAAGIANYIETKIDFAATILYNDILNIILDTTGIKKLNLRSLLVNNYQADILCSEIEVPRFTYLKITDTTTTTIVIKDLNQKLILPQ